jgi:hypothetical protein
MSVKKKTVKTALDKTALEEGLLYSSTGKETHLRGRTGTSACHEQSTNKPAEVKCSVVECDLML